MRVFVTGASGWIGSAVVPELMAAGHDVVGLARSEASAERLRAAGAHVQRGSLADLEAVRHGADKADGVIHLAFIHDFTRYDQALSTDRHAIEALGDALEGSDRPLVVASGIAAHTTTGVATEEDPPHPDFPRAAAASTTIGLAERGVRSSVVRLPPSVHGTGDPGFVPTLVNIARARRASGHVADGTNHWPAVHRRDAARLFRLVLESGAPGTVWHAVADEGVLTSAIAEVIGRHLHVPVISVAPERAPEHFGWLGVFFGVDLRATSALTRERLGWEPTGPGLLEDLDEGHYFDATAPRGLPVAR